MNTSKAVTYSLLCLVVLLPVSYVCAQTLDADHVMPDKTKEGTIQIKAYHVTSHTGVMVIASGIVNVASLQDQKPSVNVIPSPHPRDPAAHILHQRSLSSGNFPIDRMPLVPDTPIANMSSHADTISVVNGSFAGFDQSYYNMSNPPDVQIAAGPNDIMETVNLEGGIWTKQGVLVKQFTLASFFGLGSGHVISDPRVLYDMQSGRWFAELMDQTNSTISVAVSQTGNPAGNWYLYNLAYQSPCIDFPKIGTSNDKLVISTNDFSVGCESFDKSEMVVLDKNQLMEHNHSIGYTDLADKNNFSVTPARSLGSTSDLYMIANEPADSGYGVTVYKLVGTAASVSVASNSTATTTIQNDSPLVPQRATTVPLTTPPHGFEDAVWSDKRLWSAFTDACRPMQGPARHVYSCIHLLGYNTTTGRHVDFEVTNSNYNFSYPALTVDKLGAMYLVLSYSSASSYPGIFATGQTKYDPSGSVEPLVQLVGGLDPDTSCRYGDYFGASPDPTVPQTAWVAGEYHHLATSFSLVEPCDNVMTSPAWSTYIAGVSMWHAR